MQECDLIDSHAHLGSSEIFPHIEEVLKRAKEARVAHILNICTDPDTLRKGMNLAQRFPWICNAGATTPQDAEQDGDRDFSFFAQAAQEGLLAAVGETGLDYHFESSARVFQKQLLERYLHLATQTRLPVIFHCREAFSDLFAMADALYQGAAILHCFTGTMKEAEQVLNRGWYLSFSGIVTFKKSEALREIAKEVPLSSLLIETDSPFLAPQSRRGKINEPSFIVETAQCIANVKQVSLEELAQATSENARRLFWDRQYQYQK